MSRSSNFLAVGDPTQSITERTGRQKTSDAGVCDKLASEVYWVVLSRWRTADGLAERRSTHVWSSLSSYCFRGIPWPDPENPPLDRNKGKNGNRDIRKPIQETSICLNSHNWKGRINKNFLIRYVSPIPVKITIALEWQPVHHPSMNLTKNPPFLFHIMT